MLFPHHCGGKGWSNSFSLTSSVFSEYSPKEIKVLTEEKELPKLGLSCWQILSSSQSEGCSRTLSTQLWQGDGAFEAVLVSNNIVLQTKVMFPKESCIDICLMTDVHLVSIGSKCSFVQEVRSFCAPWVGGGGKGVLYFPSQELFVLCKY